METEISIRKVKLLKYKQLQVVYDQTVTHESGPVVNEVSVKDGHRAHPDLINAIRKLNFHLAMIAEQVRPNDGEFVHASVVAQNEDKEIDISWMTMINMEDLDILRKIEVTGFQMSDDSEGVALSGTRKLSTGKLLALATPTVKYDNADYRFRPDLEDCMLIVIHEVHEYINGKHAEPTQVEMDFEAGADEENAELQEAEQN